MAMAYPDYIGGPDETIFDQAFDRIGKSLQRKKTQFLFGAGMSQGVGVPNGLSLARILLRDYFPDGATHVPSDERLAELANEFPFEAIIGALEKLPGARKELTATLKSIFLDPSFHPGTAHRDFLSICLDEGVARLPSIFTTNFDHLIEDVLGDSLAVPISEDNAENIRDAQQSGKLPVIHLHGLLNLSGVVTDKYQITERDVFDQSYKILHYEFETALHYSDAFVFVGYSMNDPDFRHIYLKYQDRIAVRERIQKKTFVVSPARDRFSYTLGKAVWESRGAVWLPFTAEEFFAHLKDHMSKTYDKSLRRGVMTKYGLDEDGLKEQIQSTAKILKVSLDEALHFLNEASPKGGGGK